jgi:hypothetical protein
MDKKMPQQRPIDNAADYVDSLLRPQPEDLSVKWKFIEGRRMRDKMIGQVIVPEEAANQPPG